MRFRINTLRTYLNLRSYKFDKTNGLLIIGESPTLISIWNITGTYDVNGALILANWVSVRNITIPSSTPYERFDIIDYQLLIISCSTCETNAGRITLYNITNSSAPPSQIFSFSGSTTAVNGTMRALIGERVFLSVLGHNKFRVVYSSRN